MENKYKQDLENLANLSGTTPSTTVSVMASCDCTLSCDGEDFGKMAKGEVKKISIKKGQHIFVFKSKKHPNISVTKILDCPSITETYTLIEDELINKIPANRSGIMGALRSLFNSNTETEHETKAPSTPKTSPKAKPKSPTDDPNDKLLLYISNGNDCTKRGTIYFDTELPVLPKRVYHISFEASKWDGPVAGLSDSWAYRECWLIIMKNNKILFDFPKRNESHPDVGTFLPKTKYLFETCNCVITPCQKENTSASSSFLGFKNAFKAGLSGMDIVEDWDYATTIHLFKINNVNDYAWQGLKISSFSVKEGKITVANMIPVLHNGRACFWDEVRKQYFYNKGTGSVFYKEA